MSAANQTSNGKSYEYACLVAFHELILPFRDVTIESNSSYRVAKSHFESLDSEKKDSMLLSARAGVKTIIKAEPKLTEDGNDNLIITIQPDKKGETGDVRDLVLIRRSELWEIGVSVKHNHFAAKHPRLSMTIDFGKEWFQYPCSEQYFNDIGPIFEKLKELKRNGTKWEDVENKDTDVYQNILVAFRTELLNIDHQHPGEVPKRLLEYLIGRNDFYKIISVEKDRKTIVQSYNLHGTLNKNSGVKKPDFKTGSLKLPEAIRYFDFQKNKKTTLEMILDHNWAVTFRIHSASSKVEPSLKFDINITGMPSGLFTNHQNWES